MELRQITQQSAEFPAVEAIYDEAFPPEEKIPIQELFAKDDEKEYRMYALTDNGDTVGLMSVILFPGQILYIVFFAIDKNRRGHSYGAKALQLIKEEYADMHITLSVEEPDEAATNSEQRIKRIRFYEREGYILTDIRYEYNHGMYRLMIDNKTTEKDIEALKTVATQSGLFRIKES